MAGFNPYFVDEVVTQPAGKEEFFGLINVARNDEPELFGYEVTLSGRLVLPELRPRLMDEAITSQQAATC